MIRKLGLALVASTAFFATTAHAAYDTFLKIDGISGTSTVIGFTDYMEIYSFSLGFTRGMCSSLSVMKKMDRSSGEMTAAALLGTNFSQAVLVLRKPGERPFTYMRMTLSNVVITSIQESGSAGGDDTPTESVSVQPGSVRIEAYEQDAVGNVVLAASNSVTCQKAK